MRKLIALATLYFLCGLSVYAQTKPKLDLIPDKVMKAEFQSLDGASPIRLSSYTNRVVILVLWAEWCGPCRMALEKLNNLNRELKSRDVEIIGLAVGDPLSECDRTRALVREYKIRFQMGWMTGEMLKDLTYQGMIPQIYVIAGDGVIVEKFMGLHPTKTIPRLRQAVSLALENPALR